MIDRFLWTISFSTLESFRDHPYVSLPLASLSPSRIHTSRLKPDMVSFSAAVSACEKGQQWQRLGWALKTAKVLSHEHWKFVVSDIWGFAKICWHLDVLYRCCVWFSRWIYVNYLRCSSILCLLEWYFPFVSGSYLFFWDTVIIFAGGFTSIVAPTLAVFWFFCEANILAVASTSDISIWCWWRIPATSCNQIGFKVPAQGVEVLFCLWGYWNRHVHSKEHTYNKICIYGCFQK